MTVEKRQGKFFIERFNRNLQSWVQINDVGFLQLRHAEIRAKECLFPKLRIVKKEILQEGAL